MDWAQIVAIVLMAMSFTLATVNHGKRREGEYSIWVSMISITIWVTVLYYGGFWE